MNTGQLKHGVKEFISGYPAIDAGQTVFASAMPDAKLEFDSLSGFTE